MTHAELVERAERWLRNTRGCGVVLTEFTANGSEQPDAIGWRDGGRWSILVECKASVADFKADRHKPSRLAHHLRIGKERWYMVPRGLIAPGDTPLGWGLLEVGRRQVRVAVAPPQVRGNGFGWSGSLDEYGDAAANELPFLYSALRRHHCRTCFKDINSRERRSVECLIGPSAPRVG